MPYGSHNYIMTLYKDTIFTQNVTSREKNIVSDNDLQSDHYLKITIFRTWKPIADG